MPQSSAEKRKQAYLHQLKNSGQLVGHVFENGEVKKVTMQNPHLIEDDGNFRVEREYQGHMLSRFVKPPSC